MTRDLRILIADDNVVIRKAIQSVIENQTGWTVCGEAKDGAEAVRRTSELRPDFVLLDLAMPVLDGFHAAQQISAKHPEIFIIIVTQHYSTSLRMEATKLGIHEVISKEDVAECLVQTMNQIVAAGAGLGRSAGLAAPASG